MCLLPWYYVNAVAVAVVVFSHIIICYPHHFLYMIYISRGSYALHLRALTPYVWVHTNPNSSHCRSAANLWGSSTASPPSCPVQDNVHSNHGQLERPHLFVSPIHGSDGVEVRWCEHRGWVQIDLFVLNCPSPHQILWIFHLQHCLFDHLCTRSKERQPTLWLQTAFKTVDWYAYQIILQTLNIPNGAAAITCDKPICDNCQ